MIKLIKERITSTSQNKQNRQTHYFNTKLGLSVYDAKSDSNEASKEILVHGIQLDDHYSLVKQIIQCMSLLIHGPV